MKKRTKFTICAIVAIILYTVAVLVLAYHDHIVPDSLTAAYFTAWTAELGLLYGIKKHDEN